MATKKFYHDIDLVNVGQLIGARIQNVTTSEKTTLGGNLGTAHKGLQVWDTDLDAPFVWSGTAWLRDALEVSGDIVYKGAINPTNVGSVAKVSGYQYVVDTAGTLTAAGVTFSPSGVVEVGDVVLFTDATNATVLQRNSEQATETSLGIVELATQTEVNTGTDTNTVITPATLAGSQLATDVSELDTFTGIGTTLDTTATDLAAAINEIHGEVNTNTSNIATNASDISSLETFTGSGTTLDTTATDLAAAINEIHGEVNTNASDISSLETFTGSGTTLDTTATDLAAAINEIHGEVNTNASNIATNTSNISTNATDIDNLETYTGYNTALTTTATSLAGAVNEIDAELGTITAVAMGTTASTVSGAIAELEAEIDTNITDISALETFTGTGTTLDTTATDLAAAINEIHGEVNTNTSNIATNTSNISTNATDISNLETYTGYNTTLTGTSETTLAGAVNELNTEVGDVSTLATTATNLVGAINEVHGLLPKTYFAGNVSLTADTAVTVTHNLDLTDKDSFTIRIADSNGSTVSVDVDSVDVDSLTITSGVALTGIKVTIIGF